MAGESSSSGGSSTSNFGVGKFEINSYIVYYKTNNHLLDTGFRLLETNADYDNDNTLINSFFKLLPYGLNERLHLTTKLTPVSSDGKFYSKDFEKLMMNLRMQYIQMFLIHYPASPTHQATTFRDMPLHTDSWMAISQLHNATTFNAIGVYNYKVMHMIKLTEVIAVGPMVHKMRWYTCFDYSHGNLLESNVGLMQTAGIKALAQYYNVPTAQILMLWAIQSGGTIIPKLKKSKFDLESMRLDFRLTERDLSFLNTTNIRVNKKPTSK